MSTTNYLIRPAKRTDCKELCDLVKGLAIDMKAPEIKVTPEVLERDGFDTDSPWFKCIVAEDTTTSNSKLIGYALYYHTYHGWKGKNIHLENIYVCPSYQTSGLGTQLLKKVCEDAHQEGCYEMDFYVFKWNSATEFYTKLGAVNLTTGRDLHLWRMDKESIVALALKPLKQ